MKPKDFSLEYLYKKYKTQKKEEKGTESISENEAVLLYSRYILEDLKKRKDKKAHLHDIAKEAEIKLESILQIISTLEFLGFIAVIDRDDITGNHLIKLTDKGLKKIGKVWKK